MSSSSSQKHHYHELNADMQSMLGAIPTEFTDYWISRFPRMLSHSYHALELCSKENSFLPYYSKKYIFTKPSYFYEYTEDFTPTNLPKIVRGGRGSPRKMDDRFNNKYNNDRRPSPHDIENIGPNPNLRNSWRAPATDFDKNTKKGSYNFHRKVGDLMQTAQYGLQQPQLGTLQVPQQQSRQPSPSPSPTPPESKYVEDADGFVLVKPKHNNVNVRHRKSDGNKSTANHEDNIVWTLPK